MDRDGTINSLNEISNCISEKDKTIFAYGVYKKVATDGIKGLENEKKYLLKTIDEKNKQLDQCDQDIEKIQECIETQKQTMKLLPKALDSMKFERDHLKNEIEANEFKRDKVLKEIQAEIELKRAKFENESQSYSSLREHMNKLKQINIESRQIEVKIETADRITARHTEIQKQLFNNSIINFAKICLDNYKSQSTLNQLHKLEKEEKAFWNKYMQLKEKEKNIKLGGVSRMNSESLFNDEEFEAPQPSSILKNTTQQKNTNSSVFTIQNKSIKDSSKASSNRKDAEKFIETVMKIQNLTPVKTFNKDHSKVKILENIKIKDKDEQLRRNAQIIEKLESIVKITKGKLSQGKYSQDEKPFSSSQTSQQMKIAPSSSQEKSSAPKSTNETTKTSQTFNSVKLSEVPASFNESVIEVEDENNLLDLSIDQKDVSFTIAEINRPDKNITKRKVEFDLPSDKSHDAFEPFANFGLFQQSNDGFNAPFDNKPASEHGNKRVKFDVGPFNFSKKSENGFNLFNF